MPLPPDSVLSLLGPSIPGNQIQAIPKQAMIVRMSIETLDALESFPNQPPMDFQFGDNPGIFIGDQFFGMRPLQENAHHELYLRTSSATKKLAPLKLYANVVGKLTVERQLDNDVRDRVRESTQDAAAQRTNRKTILIDPPPAITTKKARDMFRKPTRPADKPKLSAPAPTTIKKVTSVSSMSHNKDALVPLRKRIIHCLASGEKTEEHLIRLVGGPDCSISSTQEIRDLLNEVAEVHAPRKSHSDKSANIYHLRPSSWKEVRPYEWPKLTETERTNMARMARLALNNLGIPETDPAWSHVRFRPTTTSFAGSSATSSVSEPSLQTSASDKINSRKPEGAKRAAVSHTLKDKKGKSKADSKADVMMKDEGLKAKPSHSDQVHSDSTTGLHKATNVISRPRNLEPRPNDAIDLKSIAKRAVDRESSSASTTPQQYQARSTSHQMKKQRSDSSQIQSDSERERRRVQTQERGSNRPNNDHVLNAMSLKRKLASREEEDDPPTQSKARLQHKKHKSDSTSGASEKGRRGASDQPTSDARKRDSNSAPAARTTLQNVPPAENPRRLSPPMKRIPKKVPYEESSPAHTISGSKLNSIKSNGSSKSRRAPVYTSSSSDDDIQSERSYAVSIPSKPSAASNSNPVLNVKTKSRTHTRPLPVDHASLRAKYNSSYVEYLGNFHKLFLQRRKIDHMLKHGEMGSAGSITDSDGDIELLEPDELERLAADHQKLHNELDNIRQILARSTQRTASEQT